MARFAEYVPFLPRLLAGGRLGVADLILAAERLLHEAIAVLQEVGADLAAGAGEGVEGVEVHIVG